MTSSNISPELPMIKVNAMTDAQFKVFLPLVIEDYAQNIAANIGVTIEQAREDSGREISVLLPQGRLTHHHSFYAVISAESSELIGYLWWGLDEAKKRAFLFQIFVLEPYRKKGFGRAMLKFADDTLREKGAMFITLNVFAQNRAARGLYEKHGYALTNLFMSKCLQSG